ncbi:hypothetical protein OGM63_24485 [Plectonema radiosum NIES-515]|uniref:Uncharacterized protein n=1 Tax=Plectonema radiosum NIES-515 TaxID=2986073 RepID=A0ABT3B5J4_9CYAN|nr:hypothetical protein [Plectonema radiosum]MCV3216626.1 hypothetical protein [Plectonema radiosum NIES-515]
MSVSGKALITKIEERLPERNLIDILRNVDYWTNFTRHFGPMSGSDPKIERATERYTAQDDPQDKCIHQLFEEQVTLTPDAIAVVFEGEQLTYKAIRLVLRLKS